MRSLEARIKEYENRIVMITSEINRLNEVITQRNAEVQGKQPVSQPTVT